MQYEAFTTPCLTISLHSDSAATLANRSCQRHRINVDVGIMKKTTKNNGGTSSEPYTCQYHLSIYCALTPYADALSPSAATLIRLGVSSAIHQFWWV